MTRTTNARLAGFAFLAYIATGIASLVVFGRATKGAEGTAAILASIARHETAVRVTMLLGLLCFVYAVVLAVTIWALTRDVDRDLAVIALCFRVVEGVFAAAGPVRTLALLSIAAATTAPSSADGAAANALAGVLLKAGGWSGTAAAICFALGSTVYSWLFLRGRTIPVPLAWTGVFASVLLVIVLPLQLAGFLSGPLTSYVWIPMILFEVPLGFWLIVKGVRGPETRTGS